MKRFSIGLPYVSSLPVFVALATGAWAQVPCENGAADGYPCQGLDLLSVRTIDELGGGANGNDCWGWVDSSSGREFLLVGRSNGLSIVEVTDPVNPNFLAEVPTATVQSLWRDIKVFSDHAFVVSEAAGHGMQVIDLTEVLDITDGPVELAPVSHYLGFGNAHNVVINEDTGFAFGVGTNTAGGGLHAVDISNPGSPMAAGTFEGGYTHDAQVVSYVGPDVDHAGKEVAICFNGSGGIRIVDVTDKTDMVGISSLTYAQSAYTHQGWVSEDHRFLFFNDELDEQSFGNGTRTYIADISDLDNPSVLGFYESSNTSIDHNLYVRGDLVFASNYLSGLRVSRIAPDGNLEPYAFFDTNPESDATSFDGTWSNYPYFPSGNIGITGFTHVFMVKDPNFEPEVDGLEATRNPIDMLEVYPNPASNTLHIQGWSGQASLRLVNLMGQEVQRWPSMPLVGGLQLDLSNVPVGIYLLQVDPAHGALQTRKVIINR